MTNLHFGKAADTTHPNQSDSPTAYFKWRFQRGRLSYVANATVATRRAQIGIGPAVGQGEIIVDTGNVTAGQTIVGTGGVAGNGEGGAQHIVWRATEVVNSDDVLWIVITAFQAGDTYTWDLLGSEDLGTEDTG